MIAVINSMTKKERRNPDLLNGSRRARVARGSGQTPADVNKVLKQYQQMEKMMGKLGRGGMKGMMRGLQGMMGGHKNTYDSIKAFSETDFTEDLKKFDVPTIIIHGDDDQIVPIDAAARASATLVKNSQLVVYPGAPHGITDTHKDKLNADMLAFVKS